MPSLCFAVLPSRVPISARPLCPSLSPSVDPVVCLSTSTSTTSILNEMIGCCLDPLDHFMFASIVDRVLPLPCTDHASLNLTFPLPVEFQRLSDHLFQPTGCRHLCHSACDGHPVRLVSPLYTFYLFSLRSLACSVDFVRFTCFRHSKQ